MQARYDQHILIDINILNDITNIANMNNKDIILEIGSGPGNLTELLLKKAKQVIAIELDKRFKDSLKELVKRHNNLQVYFGNALDLINNFKFDKVISNIPYSITEPLFKKLFKLIFKRGIFIIGKNFFNKINNKNNKWHYIISSYYKISLIKEVSRSLFSPVPRTDSVLISIEPKTPDKSERLIRSLTLQDDKKLKNALIELFRDEFKLTNNQAKEKLFSLLIPENILDKNVDYLSNKQFIFIIEKLRF